MYKHVALGGTFDLLHIGHIALIERAFKISKLVSIGITTDKFASQLGKVPYESQSLRRKNLTNWLKSKKLAQRSTIVFLNDLYGTTLKEKSIEAIVVTSDTRRGAEKINKERSAKRLKKLKIIEIPTVKADDGKPITSGRIRRGEISINGQNYQKILEIVAGIRFKQKIRENLKKPFGPLITGPIKNTKVPIITVGDVTTAKFLKLQVIPRLAIVDFLVHRQPVYKNLQELGFTQPNPDYLVKNPPGQIAKQLLDVVKKALASHQKQVIQVIGEEDLAFIPALLLAPIPSIILYGQPSKGLVRVDATPTTKEKLCALLKLT